VFTNKLRNKHRVGNEFESFTQRRAHGFRYFRYKYLVLSNSYVGTALALQRRGPIPYINNRFNGFLIVNQRPRGGLFIGNTRDDLMTESSSLQDESILTLTYGKGS